MFLTKILLTCVNIIKGICHTIQLLKEIVRVDVFCVGPYTVFLRGDLHVRVHVPGSTSGCRRFGFLNRTVEYFIRYICYTQCLVTH